MRITYAGHATVLIEADGTTLITDPLLRNRVLHLRRVVPPLDVETLTRADGVLISHTHHDHLDVPSLRRLPSSCRGVCPSGAGRAVRRAGTREITELAPGESVRVGELDVAAVPAVHDGRRWKLGPARAALGYVIEGERRAYFAGDTDLYDGMREIGNRGLDLALLPVWGWGGHLPAGHLDPHKAATAAAMLRPRIAVPIHWGTFASPRAPWRDDPAAPARAFVDSVASAAPDVEVRVLAPGESFSL